MEIINMKKILTSLALLSVVLLASPALLSARAADNGPELPPMCGVIAAPADSKLLFHTYALGVQIYRWNGVRWNFVGPEARLYADANYRGLVGTHYAGPTWESNSGSTVVASRVEGCTPDAAAIQWLLLSSVSNGGSGIFDKADHIQRVNTAGGLEPAAPGSSLGDEKRVPYTAEYYFYRSQD